MYEIVTLFDFTFTLKSERHGTLMCCNSSKFTNLTLSFYFYVAVCEISFHIRDCHISAAIQWVTGWEHPQFLLHVNYLFLRVQSETCLLVSVKLILGQNVGGCLKKETCWCETVTSSKEFHEAFCINSRGKCQKNFVYNQAFMYCIYFTKFAF